MYSSHINTVCVNAKMKTTKKKHERLFIFHFLVYIIDLNETCYRYSKYARMYVYSMYSLRMK